MMGIKSHMDIPEDVVRRNMGEGTINVEFIYHPGREPSGMSGPPEHYDPGEGPDAEITSPKDLSPEEEERAINYIVENFELYDPSDDEADYHYEMMRDERDD